ncbi:unnamed protein product [Arctia plantaginis]|uniref:Cuticle protein 19 n=1 Tax=Arctia plantaginis TaxID=874455 RepID=A0A8S1AD86_ARCPL|nr:unnamed protein product [Arctia plantaginis]
MSLSGQQKTRWKWKTLFYFLFTKCNEPYATSIISGTGNSPKYEYKYEVSDHQTGDRKSHWEKRDGDNVRGVYTLYEPDGALRTVEYTADALHGFNAVVKREKPNKHQQRSNTLYTYDMPSNSAHNIFDDSSVGYTSDRKILPIQENGSKHAAKSDGFSFVHGHNSN